MAGGPKRKIIVTRIEESISTPQGAEAAPDAPIETTVREQILGRFEAWLDEVMSGEEPPQGIAAEIWSQLQSGQKPLRNAPEKDRYSLWSALTALTQETKLQGRTFKQLQEQLTPMTGWGDLLKSLLAGQEESLAATRSMIEQAGSVNAEQERAQVQVAQRQVREEFLRLLLDVRDRLVRGLDLARQHRLGAVRQVKPNWLMRILRQNRPNGGRQLEATEALIRGYELSLLRLEEALQELEVCEIACKGQPFDPTCMTAVDIEETTQVPEGTVCDVYRAGYKCQDRVFRTAEVKVSRRPGHSDHGEQ